MSCRPTMRWLPLGVLAVLAAIPAAGREINDVEFASTDGRKIPAAISMPEGAGPFPVVVTIHGGQGGREPAVVRTLAEPGGISATVDMLNDQPWAIVSVSYRAGAILRNEEDDVVAGIRFAASLDHIDKDRVGVLGGSHGGHLALRAAEVMGDELQCVAVGSPWMTNPEVYLFGDFGEPPLSEISEQARKWLLDTRSRLLGGLEQNPNLTTEDLRRLIAQRSIEAHAEDIVVPTLFLTSRSDVQVPHELVEPTISRLKAAGREVTVYTAGASVHGFYWGRDIDGGARAGMGPKTEVELEEESIARAHVLDFFRRCFAEQR